MMGNYKKLICPETDKPCEAGCRFGACAQRTDTVRQAQTAKVLPAVLKQQVVRGTRLPG
jgi:hypothetical protein